MLMTLWTRRSGKDASTGKEKLELESDNRDYFLFLFIPKLSEMTYREVSEL